MHGTHVLLKAYMGVVAAVGLAVITISMGMTAADHASASRPRVFVLVFFRPEPAAVAERVCVPRSTQGLTVGGLGVAVPRLPDAVRLNYQGGGFSQYTVRSQAEQVMAYYAAELAADCWEPVVQQDTEALWARDGQSLRIAVAQQSEENRSSVDYQVLGTRLGQVRGVSTLLAQDSQATPSPTPTPGDYPVPPPPPDYYPMPPEGSYPQPPMPGGSPYPSGAAIPSGSPYSQPTFGGQYQTPPPGGSIGTLFADPACGENGYRDPNGGCLQLRSGQIPLLGQGGQVLICGDTMCDEGKGENQSNCPKDCGGSTPPGSPGSQYPGQAPGGFQGQPGQFPGGPGGPGGFGPGGPGFQGPSEEDFQRMQTDQLKQMQQGAKGMQQGVKFMRQGMRLAVKKLQACKMSLPEGLEEALAAMEQAIPKIKAAQSFDEVMEAMETAQEAGERMQQAGEEIPQRIMVCEQLKRVKTVMKNLQRRFKTVNGKAQRSKNDSVIALAKAAEEKMNAAQQLADQLPGLATTDVEKAEDSLDEFHAAVEEAHNTLAAVEAALNARQGMTVLNRELRTIERQLTGYEKKGEDVSAAKALVAQLKEDIAAVQQALKDGASGEDLVALVEDVYLTREELRDALAEITGLHEYETEIKVNEKPYQYDVPDAFRGPSRSGAAPEGLAPTEGFGNTGMPGNTMGPGFQPPSGGFGGFGSP
ncbi:MAG: SH3 type 3 domain-containing protein [Parcubacteria group bacterium Gr01-1014_31]|nr:MAG: SH3 type 3 domain-containing protein [Parcubacteria group bacterium Gr01-1014_31]